MSKILDAELEKANKSPWITDTKGESFFKLASNAIKDSATASEKYAICDDKRLGDGAAQLEAAYTYLALGFNMKRNPEIQVGKITPWKMFHFAGHAFREIGQLNRAADAYWRAGVISDDLDFSVRSLARAKSCYSEIGETEDSDTMHILEWNARRRLSSQRRFAKALLWIWSITSKYGTSSGRWFLSVGVFLGVFTVGYEVLHRFGYLTCTQVWTPMLTAAYMAVVTTATVGFGDILPNNWISQSVVILNILIAYGLLAIGSTILGRNVLGR
jgi:hypothetical protein